MIQNPGLGLRHRPLDRQAQLGGEPGYLHHHSLDDRATPHFDATDDSNRDFFGASQRRGAGPRLADDRRASSPG
jgi:hypothetical protein